MPCNCKSSRSSGKSIISKTPDTPCVFCAHKHIATAKQLYDLELGYKDINKSHAIGQLILAAWHYDKEHHNLALRCRDIWLKMEKLEDVNCLLDELQNKAWEMVIKSGSEEVKNLHEISA